MLSDIVVLVMSLTARVRHTKQLLLHNLIHNFALSLLRQLLFLTLLYGLGIVDVCAHGSVALDPCVFGLPRGSGLDYHLVALLAPHASYRLKV
jgi:hypothetical protein